MSETATAVLALVISVGFLVAFSDASPAFLRRRRQTRADIEESIRRVSGQDQTGPLSERQIDALGRYNAEVGRGIVHTDEWKAKMAALQDRYYGTADDGDKPT